MSDGHQNAVETQRRRSPELDLNQAFTREEEEEDQEDPKGPHWLQVRQQEPWLQSREQHQASQQQKQKAMEASPSSLPKEQHQHQHQTVAENPNSHGGEKQSQQAMGENLNSLQEDQQQQQQGENLISGAMAKQNSHVMETWNFSDSMEVLRQKPSLLEDRKKNPEKPALPSSPGTMWEHQRVVFPHGRKSLSPVSPPEQRKSLSPVSPDRRFSEEQLETALPRGRSSERRTSPYRSPHRKHSPRGDSFSRWRHERDLSMSPRDFFKRHRERSLSTSPAGRSNRVGRSRSRSPPLRGYHHSPRPRYSPRGRYSPRRRSPPSSYRPKRRPWSPPPNRNTGLGKPGRNLFIAGFSFGTTERDLERKFSRYGHVKDVRIVRDKRSGDSRGFGFLSLDRDEDADAAIRGLDQTEWNGRIVLVEKAKSPSN